MYSFSFGGRNVNCRPVFGRLFIYFPLPGASARGQVWRKRARVFRGGVPASAPANGAPGGGRTNGGLQRLLKLKQQEDFQTMKYALYGYIPSRPGFSVKIFIRKPEHNQGGFPADRILADATSPILHFSQIFSPQTREGRGGEKAAHKITPLSVLSDESAVRSNPAATQYNCSAGDGNPAATGNPSETVCRSPLVLLFSAEA